MSGGAVVAGSPTKAAESPLSSGGRKRDSQGSAPPLSILKDVGEIYSRLLDHRPVIQGEMRYFIKEFEEKRGLREVRVLENLKNTVSEANDQTLPKCEQVMHGSLNEVFMRLQAATEMMNSLQKREQEEIKQVEVLLSPCNTYLQVDQQAFLLEQLQTEKLVAGEKHRIALWEEFMKEQISMKTVVDEEHTKAMKRLKEQYATMEKDLTKHTI